MARNCNFGVATDGLIKDQIIKGLRKDQVVERLLKETNLDLTTCIKVVKSYDVTQRQIKEIDFDESQHVNRISKNMEKSTQHYRDKYEKSNEYDTQREQGHKQCYRCGYVHDFKCPAYNQRCKSYKKFWPLC